MREKTRARKIIPVETSGNMTENSNELGLIKIHENVIASIVRKVTCSIEGVVRLAGSPLIDNIAEIVGSRKIQDRAIAVNMDGSDVSIEVKINIAYGIHVPTLAAEVQTAVMEEVEKITGMHVVQVNVIVQELDEDVEFDEDENEENSENKKQ